MSLVDPIYVCPQTRQPLQPDGGGLKVQETGHTYPVANGIPNFLRFAPVEDIETTAKLDRLNDLARAGNDWKKALEATYDAQFIRYVTHVDRSSFLDLLTINKQSEVLEIGPGLGQFTALLAERGKSVHALEVVPGQAEFALTRCHQQGLSNVNVAVGGDDCRLPYRDQTFDLVVLNLVFEWCATRLENESHSSAQTRLLSEMARVLKPGGSLYLATKNRYALRLLVGGQDEHLFGIRFGSALPRGLAAWMLQRRGRPRSMGMLYSHNALQSMLRNAGFENTRSFWATPEMRYPTQYVATDAASVRAARVKGNLKQGGGRLVGLLMRFVPARWVRNLTPGLAFLALKSAAPPASDQLSPPVSRG